MLSRLLDTMACRAEEELLGRILPFWLDCRDKAHGGFVGRIDGGGVRHDKADKGSVMTARILWTFSAAYAMYPGHGEFLEAASAARDFLCGALTDKEYGGVYWSVGYDGAPVATRKQIYAQAFAVYALAEFYRASGDESALEQAVAIYDLIERLSFDAGHGGYVEALTREWQPAEDMRLSAKDRNDVFTMNTHLHVAEAYGNLLSVWSDAGLRERVANIVGIFESRIIAPDGRHLGLFFDRNWHRNGDVRSFGHDIEASWLLPEVAAAAGDYPTTARARRMMESLAEGAAAGLMSDGSTAYEYDPSTGEVDCERHWWVQAESVVGWLSLYKASGDPEAAQRAAEAFDYIMSHLRDMERGEWFWSVGSDCRPNRRDDKAGEWKCPYHNSRMCMEIMKLLRNK